ncbi:TetR/AcrR family transcriptional regulator [Ilumatobacter sp.]|uniref:TetR/AcrR family transcriptional regulator n=1 Tax=Ilumatobacter sp. TaxID=1967498 RepID=UPI003C65FFD8
MNDDIGPVKRQYRQSERAERTAETRARIRTAAASLFLDRGFVAASMKQIAKSAGVGERTLYDAFPTKTALFEHVVGVAIAGDERPIPVAERPEFAKALAEHDLGAAIAEFANYATEILERSGALIMVAVESAGADPTMCHFADRGAAATRDNAARFVEHLSSDGPLSPDAADTVFALVSPHVHQLLRHGSGFTADEYRCWLTRSIAALIILDND